MRLIESTLTSKISKALLKESNTEDLKDKYFHYKVGQSVKGAPDWTDGKISGVIKKLVFLDMNYNKLVDVTDEYLEAYDTDDDDYELTPGYQLSQYKTNVDELNDGLDFIADADITSAKPVKKLSETEICSACDTLEEMNDYFKDLDESDKLEEFKVGDTVFWISVGNEISDTGHIINIPTEDSMTVKWNSDGEVNTYSMNQPDIIKASNYDNSINESNDLKESQCSADDIADFMIDFDQYGYDDAYDGNNEEKRELLIQDINRDKTAVISYLKDVVAEELGTTEQQEKAKELLNCDFLNIIEESASKLVYTKIVKCSDGDSIMYTDEFSDEEAIDNYIKDYANEGITKENCTVEELNEPVIVDLNEEVETPTAGDFEKDDEDINNSKRKEIEDQIGTLKNAIKDKAYSDEEEMLTMKKEIEDLEEKLTLLDESSTYTNTAEKDSNITLSDDGKLESTSHGEIINFGNVAGFIKINNTTYMIVKDKEVYAYSIDTEFPFVFRNTSGNQFECDTMNKKLDEDINTDEIFNDMISSIDDSINKLQNISKEKDNKLNKIKDEAQIKLLIMKLTDRMNNEPREFFKDMYKEDIEMLEKQLHNSKAYQGTNKDKKLRDALNKEDKVQESVSVATPDGSNVNTEDAASVSSNGESVSVETKGVTVTIAQNNIQNEPADDVQLDEPISNVIAEPDEQVSDDLNESDEDGITANVEATSLSVVKNQGNVYMLLIKETDGTERYWICDNFNSETNEADNADFYDSKEDADKDYFDRVGLEQ